MLPSGDNAVTLLRRVYLVLLDDAVPHLAGRRLPGDADAGAVA